MLTPGVLVAGKFNCGTLGTSSEMVALVIPRPPDAYPQIKSIKVEIGEVDKAFTDHVRLRMQIEQALAHDFSVSAAKPDARLRVSVVAYDQPTMTRVTRTGTKTVGSGKSVTTVLVPVLVTRVMVGWS